MKQKCFALATVCAVSLAAHAFTIPNASFEQGTGASVPHWSLTDKAFGGISDQGADGKQSIFILGNGVTNHYWLSDILPFAAGQTYKLTHKAKATPGSSGCIVTGPVFANSDETVKSGSWQDMSTIFTVPDQPADHYRLRFGQWMASGKVLFDDIRLVPVQPVYQSVDGITLGDGEKVTISEYACSLTFTGEGGNQARPLVYSSASFNSSRWVFGQGSKVIYCHDIGTRRQLAATLSLVVSYHASGKLMAYASGNRETWSLLGELDRTGNLTVSLPKALFPARRIYIRLEAAEAPQAGTEDFAPGSFQINAYNYTSTLEGTPVSITGTTTYMEVDNCRDDLELNLLSIDDCVPGKVCHLHTKVTNRGAKPLVLKPKSWACQSPFSSDCPAVEEPETVLPPKATRLVSIPFRVGETGIWTIHGSLTDQTRLAFNATIPHYLATGYGQVISQTPGTASVWTASSGWKIPPERAIPTAKASGMTLALAANEAEAAQLVITPEKDLTGVTLKASPFRSESGRLLPDSAMELLQVYYHDVSIKTDYTGYLGKWPDALPPIAAPLNLKSGVNHPLWLRVTAPKGTKAGVYRGTVTIKANGGWTCQVPVQIRVFGFDLPDEMTCETAFGFGLNTAFDYHKPENAKQKREIMHKYLDYFAKHHISLYDPVPMDNFHVQLVNKQGRLTWHGDFNLDRQTKAEGAASIHLLDRYNDRNVAASCAKSRACSPRGLTVTFKYKAARGHRAGFTIAYYDGANSWLPGRNQDAFFSGTGDWTAVSRKVPAPPKNAKTWSFTFRATEWTDQGLGLGEVWFDELKITDNATGKVVLQDDFVPLKPEDYDIRFHWDRWDKAMAEHYARYHFNSFSLPVMGLGSGTYHSRVQPTFFGFSENSPEYAYLHKKYLAELQRHLVDTGWIDKAYVYWFDEPDPKDYEFVLNGFRKLKAGAPRIRRMLTEQIEPKLVGGPNLWCAITSAISLETIEPRQKAGDQVWWYVCTAPKAPYAALFIDHPATDMRAWLWQTWKHGVTGILVWATNYWTSNCAYPDPNHPQNPYADPMGWVSGYATHAGTKIPWGNGDGRFVYPPLAAANGDSKVPVMEDPVACIRAEMLRDGIEDYEYFVILKSLLKQKRITAEERRHYARLLDVPRGVTESMTAFTTSPKPIEEHRQQLGEAIEVLMRH